MVTSSRYDLHVHSNVSDGTLPPREIIALAVERGLSGVAITDHDTVAGLDEAMAMAGMLGVRCIAGVELTTATEAGDTVHLLGYCFDPQHAGLSALLEALALQRSQRAVETVARLRALGLQLTLEDVLAHSGGRPPGRPHIARAMREVGAIATESEAFGSRWMESGGPAHVPMRGVPLNAAIDMLHAAGGVAVIAHPGLRTSDEARRTVTIEQAARAGLDGLEVDHPDHRDDAIRHFGALADRLRLIQTGGSDDHARGIDGPRLACRTVSERVVVALERRAAAHRAG